CDERHLRNAFVPSRTNGVSPPTYGRASHTTTKHANAPRAARRNQRRRSRDWASTVAWTITRQAFHIGRWLLPACALELGSFLGSRPCDERLSRMRRVPRHSLNADDHGHGSVDHAWRVRMVLAHGHSGRGLDGDAVSEV